MSKKCAIIGAGASGLVAAIEAARKGANVTVFEKNQKCGRKLLATGNGRCNITNTSLGLEHFHSNNMEYIKPILGGFDTSSCIEYFKNLGIEIIQTDEGKCFPMSFQARSVVELLVFTCKELGVDILLDCEVLHVKSEGDKLAIKLAQETQYFDSVLIASGSLANPNLGSSESGLEFAKEFGHKIHPTYASLVQLVTIKDLKSASGAKLFCGASVVVQGQIVNRYEGDVLFTNYGLSGLAILNASKEVAMGLRANGRVQISLDLFPQLSKEALRGFFQKRMKFLSNMPLLKWLEGVMNHKIAKLILDELKLDQNTKMDSKILNRLVHTCKRLSFEIKETKGSSSAEVMAGGIALDEVDSKTMASKKIKGLYFSGEVLDVDGDLGGYNLHFAWASGIKAGKAMAC